MERAVLETHMNPVISTINYAPLLRIKYLFGDIGDKLYKSVYHRVVAQLSFGPSMLASVTHVFVSAHDDFIHRSKVAGQSDDPSAHEFHSSSLSYRLREF